MSFLIFCMSIVMVVYIHEKISQSFTQDVKIISPNSDAFSAYVEK